MRFGDVHFVQADIRFHLFTKFCKHFTMNNKNLINKKMFAQILYFSIKGPCVVSMAERYGLPLSTAFQETLEVRFFVNLWWKRLNFVGFGQQTFFECKALNNKGQVPTEVQANPEIRRAYREHINEILVHFHNLSITIFCKSKHFFDKWSFSGWFQASSR